MIRKNDNLSRAERARLRALAEYHGQTVATGPYPGQGSQFKFLLAIVHGDVQTLSLDPEEVAELTAWLDAQAEGAGPIGELLRDVADQLRFASPPPQTEPAGEARADTGPIDTLEG